MTDDPSQSYHYGVVRRALDILDAEPGLPLEGLADRLGMSPAHVQRVFSRWAGLSPKRYGQYLTLGHAKTLLRERHTVLEVADATGLSGGGRLHDLFVKWEAMSPGAFATGGAGVVISWGWFETPFGPAIAMGTERGLCGMGFAAEIGAEEAKLDLMRRWPHADFVEDAARLQAWVDGAFGQGGETRLVLSGAPFQIKVWEALLQVPSGHVTTYSDIAQAVGNPRAVRAVGTAVGRNPISWLIPCHRALRKSGGLGGYHWGLPMKRAMLAYESAQRDAG